MKLLIYETKFALITKLGFGLESHSPLDEKDKTQPDYEKMCITKAFLSSNDRHNH